MKKYLFPIALLALLSCHKETPVPIDIHTWNRNIFCQGLQNEVAWNPDSIYLRPTKDAPHLLTLSFVNNNPKSFTKEELNFYGIPMKIGKYKLFHNAYYPIVPELPRCEYWLTIFEPAETRRIWIALDDYDPTSNMLQIETIDLEKGKITGTINANFYDRPTLISITNLAFVCSK